MNAPAETLKFEAEVAQVLHLVTHSLYSHKEIFLRELISNASDACDKLRFESIANPALSSGDSELHIDVSWDEQARTITVRDNGIGMTREEVIANIGTIASSGTRRFLEAMSGEQKADARLIGQFGVGFYSAFVVADRVTVLTRRAVAPASEGVKWESDGRGEYTLEALEMPERGTAVILHLKADEDEFLKPWKLRSLVTQYSDHVAFPIRMPADKSDLADDETAPRDEWTTVNAASALWSKPKSEISDEAYRNFYTSLGHDFNEPLAWSHNRVEGNQSFTTLLYLPSQPPFDLMMGGRDERKGLKLYIKRVFVMDAAEELLPNYLRFVRGVVDADDLPLNVSRELLQANPVVARISKALVKRVLAELKKKAEKDPEAYTEFWSAFGQVIKEGIYEDHERRDELLKLARFKSTAVDGITSLDDYIARMKEGQNEIFLITGDNAATMKQSPQLEAFRARGVEVLLLDEPVDEFWTMSADAYEGKSFASVSRGDIDLSTIGGEEAEAEKEKDAAPEGELSALIALVKLALEKQVKDVRESKRLTDSACCLVVDEGEMNMRLQKMLKASGQLNDAGQQILEINARHPLIKALADKAKGGSSREIEDMAYLLLDQARILEGEPPADIAAFARRMSTAMAKAVG